MTQQEIIDAVGCGTEIAADAAQHGYVPRAMRDNGRIGDAKCVLYACGSGEAIDTNGGAHWSEQHDGETWAEMVAELIDDALTYRWRTDAASGEIVAPDAERALDCLVTQREWARVGSAREARDIEDGAWLTITDQDGVAVYSRGVMP